MRPREHASIDPWRGLTHPAWWVCLALLLLNDHVLKGAGLLPGVVTGKLGLKPYLVGDWLVGLFVMDDATLSTKQYGGFGS